MPGSRARCWRGGRGMPFPFLDVRPRDRKVDPMASSTFQSLRGQLLVSTPSLHDPSFRHTVVLVGEHTPDGALGVILNRPLKLRVEEGIPQLAPLVEPGARLFEGGPVHPTSPVLLAEFREGWSPDLPVFGRVGFLTGEVSEQVLPGIERARVYAGYAGWGDGQLEGELAEGAWVLDPAQLGDLFADDPAGLWRQVLLRKGPGFEDMARVPFDPRMN
jgi:putative transcriptional regulator